MGQQTIDISQATSDMKLIKPVTNASGMVLMPEGIRLTPIFIDRLKKWGVQTVEVMTEKDESPAAPVPQADARASGPTRILEADRGFAQRITGDVAKRFVLCKDYPLMMQLRTIVAKHLFQHGPKGMLNTIRFDSAAEPRDGVRDGN